MLHLQDTLVLLTLLLSCRHSCGLSIISQPMKWANCSSPCRGTFAAPGWWAPSPRAPASSPWSTTSAAAALPWSIGSRIPWAVRKSVRSSTHGMWLG